MNRDINYSLKVYFKKYIPIVTYNIQFLVNIVNSTDNLEPIR